MKIGRLSLVVGAIVALGAGTASAGSVPYPTYFREFTLKASASHGDFKGKIGSPKAKCVNERKVKLYRKHSGAKQKLGGDKTNAKGKFAIDLSKPKLKDGSYYAKVKKKGFDNGSKVCLDVTSGTIKVSS
jgi:hypothetical protein